MKGEDKGIEAPAAHKTAPAVEEGSSYWDEVGEVWQQEKPYRLWRKHSDAVNVRLLHIVFSSGEIGTLLKTDLFDEAYSEGLYPVLQRLAREVIGIDLSERVVQAALARYPGLNGRQADVRTLPFEDGTFDAIVSNSTLDHFATLDELKEGLQELFRVLCPGGRLLLTLDNAANPLVALRNALPFSFLQRLGLVPYFVGATCGPWRLRRMVEEVGFEVRHRGAILHCPRVVAVKLAGILERHTGPVMQRRFLRFLAAFEQLARWPTRYLTGHFVVVEVRRPLLK